MNNKTDFNNRACQVIAAKISEIGLKKFEETFFEIIVNIDTWSPSCSSIEMVGYFKIHYYKNYNGWSFRGHPLTEEAKIILDAIKVGQEIDNFNILKTISESESFKCQLK